MESFLEAWDLICDYCKKQVTDVSYETWFSKLVPISLDFGAGVAIIQAPNEFNKSTIERGFHKCLNDAVQSVSGEAFTYLRSLNGWFPGPSSSSERPYYMRGSGKGKKKRSMQSA